MAVSKVRFNTSKLTGMRFARLAMYCCRECQDTGFVKVYHPEVVKQSADARINPTIVVEWHRTCMTLCSCDTAIARQEAIDRLPANKRPKECTIPIFGSQTWHINANLEGSEDLARSYCYGQETSN